MRYALGNIAARRWLMLAAILLAACGQVAPPEKSHLLVVGILPGPTTYQKSNDAVSGFEYDLIEDFAASQNLKTHYVVVKDLGALLQALYKGKIHLAAGVSIDGNPRFVFSTPIRESKQVLVSADDDQSPDELSGMNIEVLARSPQVDMLKALAGDPPRFTVREVEGVSAQELLQRVADGKSVLAVTDMLNYSLAASLSPDLTVIKEFPEKAPRGWAFLPKNALLAQKADAFIASIRKDGTLARLQDRYFGHIQRIKADGVARYIHDIHTVLPYYRKQFEAAQASTGIDWRLIAALAYQESKWDPLATSFTNVRGIMMLTEETADRLGVDNRLDAAQSIRAGGNYLAMLRDELPGGAPEPDRTWLALAAYNLGMGHLNGARTFARKMKRDPNSWYDMKKVLPLMSRPEFYARLKAGPARGGEAVILVENVRNYFDILSRLEPAWEITPRLSEAKEPVKKARKTTLAGSVRIGAALGKDPAKAPLRLPENTAETLGKSLLPATRDAGDAPAAPAILPPGAAVAPSPPEPEGKTQREGAITATPPI